MFQIIKPDTKFNFTNKFKITGPLSLLLVLASLGMILSGNMQYGVDFRGGAEIQVGFNNPVSLAEMRSELTKAGFDGVSVQTIGEDDVNDYLVKVKASEENLNEVTDKIYKTLETSFASQGINKERFKTDIVGPKAGSELRKAGFQAMLFALLAIFIYIGLRFDIKYSPGAIVALTHDVIIILGIFSLAGKEFTLQTVAALLAVIGYSVNDTVVVYDRVREHEEKYSGRDLKDHIDNAISETLSRTFLTSGTTLFVSGSMFFYGGGAIHDFFFAISLGVLIGTYSSIYVAAPVTLITDKIKNKQPIFA